ncbi:MAG: hypothetical protein M9962_14360 [Oligoflexia bacterium]|nr:hypothetical protein [Oligoflexia bacterium]
MKKLLSLTLIALTVSSYSLFAHAENGSRENNKRRERASLYCAGNYVYNLEGKSLAYTSSCSSVVFNKRTKLFCAGNYVYNSDGKSLAYTSSCSAVVFSKRNPLFCAGNYIYNIEGRSLTYVSSCEGISF